MDPLIKAGARVGAWDNVGHGASPQPAERALYRGDEFVADLAALVDRYGQGLTPRRMSIGDLFVDPETK